MTIKKRNTAQSTFAKNQKLRFVVSHPNVSASLFEKILPLLQLQVKEAGVNFEVQVSESLPEISGNENQLEQVFLNLVSNACHALEAGGAIKIRASADPSNWIRIDFEDNGVGIKKEYLSKVFDPFFTTKKSGIGTGLGLSIVYSIVQEHGGWIEVESQENRGTVFKIFLPTILKKRETNSEIEKINPTLLKTG